MRNANTHEAAARFWDRESEQPSHINWMADPRVRAYANQLVSGAPDAWPMDWLISILNGRRFRRALSIGCGSGALERDLIARNLCDTIDAFDASPVSIDTARRLANEAGIGHRIHYSVRDFNNPHLPRRAYDLIAFHQSLHHVAKMERLLREILRALNPNGLLYLDEYVGPSRFDWNDTLIAPHRAWFNEHVPQDARLNDPMPYPIATDDPSEALRSDEIVRQISRGFRILQRRDYGGTLLSVIYPMVKWDLAPASLVPDLLEAEEAMIASGAPSYYTVIVAAPKRLVARMKARAAYWLTSKLRRLRWEIRSRSAPEGATVKF
ncbi:MAG TPA: methyltransferase [Thermoanaerobaculia bacterium]|nr:methyltransferase [Thermoanaerobaculia bacterium]